LGEGDGLIGAVARTGLVLAAAGPVGRDTAVAADSSRPTGAVPAGNRVAQVISRVACCHWSRGQR
jgi:hypothetical protein